MEFLETGRSKGDLIGCQNHVQRARWARKARRGQMGSHLAWPVVHLARHSYDLWLTFQHPASVNIL